MELADVGFGCLYLAGAALERICERYKISPTMGAATLIAFGSSAPELAISCVGASSGQTELSFPTLLASAVIAFGLIPAVTLMCAGSNAVVIDFCTVLRDAGFYSLGLACLWHFSADMEIHLWQAGVFIAVYVFYIGAVAFPSVMGAGLEKKDGNLRVDQMTPLLNDATFVAEDPARAAKAKADSGAKKAAADYDQPDEGASDSEVEEATAPEHGVVLEALRAPFELLFRYTILGGAITVLVATLLWLGSISYLAIFLVERMCAALHINESLAGLTILAFGAQIPDTIAAVELARSGMANAGISQAVGSQVINISVGIGLPLAIYTLISGQPTVNENARHIEIISLFTFGMIGIYILSFLPYVEREAPCRPRWLCCCGDSPLSNYRAILGPLHAKVLLAAFIVCYLGCILVATLY